MVRREAKTDVPTPGVADPVDGLGHPERVEHLPGGSSALAEVVPVAGVAAAAMTGTCHEDEPPVPHQLGGRALPAPLVDEETVPEKGRRPTPLGRHGETPHRGLD